MVESVKIFYFLKTKALHMILFWFYL